MSKLKAPSIEQTPGALLEEHITEAAARLEPIPVESDEGKQMYRALVQHVWRTRQRPVVASDIRDLWERIDSIKRGSPARYEVCGIHFWAAEFANTLCSGAVELDPECGRRLAAWLDDWPNICILGHTGRGKSSTINRLFGVRVAEISHHDSCTQSVTDYRLVTGSFLNRPTGIVLWDLPGYGDERLPFDHYVTLYKRLARKCDVVVFMLDNEWGAHLDIKMFRKLNDRVKGLYRKLVIALNKADLFHPYDWNEDLNTPSEKMQASIERRVNNVATRLEMKDATRIVPISALKDWNVYGLVTAMVDAAGESKGAKMLRAIKHDAAPSATEAETGKRFGVEV
ncbi:MAG TPA: GTPase [Planctomycetota bacterium]|nr:GTPase [Planctomycetota bacterium]